MDATSRHHVGLGVYQVQDGIQSKDVFVPKYCRTIVLYTKYYYMCLTANHHSAVLVWQGAFPKDLVTAWGLRSHRKTLPQRGALRWTSNCLDP